MGTVVAKQQRQRESKSWRRRKHVQLQLPVLIFPPTDRREYTIAYRSDSVCICLCIKKKQVHAKPGSCFCATFGKAGKPESKRLSRANPSLTAGALSLLRGRASHTGILFSIGERSSATELFPSRGTTRLLLLVKRSQKCKNLSSALETS